MPAGNPAVLKRVSSFSGILRGLRTFSRNTVPPIQIEITEAKSRNWSTYSHFVDGIISKFTPVYKQIKFRAEHTSSEASLFIVCRCTRMRALSVHVCERACASACLTYYGAYHAAWPLRFILSLYKGIVARMFIRVFFYPVVNGIRHFF